MRLYLELAKKSFQRQVAYRSATIAGFATNVFFGGLRASILIAVFDAQTRDAQTPGAHMPGALSIIAGYSVRDAVTYTGVTQALIAMTALWGWFDMIRSIKSGEVASDLAKPFDYYGFWLAQDVGRGVYQLVARGVTIMAVFVALFGASLPATAEQWALAMISVALALLLSFAWRFLVSTIAFWATDALGIARMLYFLMTFPSGFVVPVAFMPDWLQALCYATPFPSFINTPVEVYLGRAQGADGLGLIAVQALWLAALVALGRGAAEAGRRKLTIQGG